MKAWVLVLAIIAALILSLLLLSIIGWLQLILLALGLLAFAVVVAGILLSALVTLVAIPYYFFTKRAKVVPGRYGLDQVREK